MMVLLLAGTAFAQLRSERAEPKVGYAAQSQGESTVVGCVNGSGDRLRTVQAQGAHTYTLQGDSSQLRAAAGKMVQLTGQATESGGESGFQVARIEVVQDRCSYDEKTMAVTGKAGNEGDADNVTSTATTGMVTPPRQSEAGKKQAPGDTGSQRSPERPAQFGAPKTAEQTAQNPAEAEKIAQAASRAELSDAQRQLGVNARPDYSQNRNDQSKTELPGASQRMPASAERRREAAENQKPRPTLTGCLSASGHERAQEFFLIEEGTGRRVRLNGTPEQFKDHLNHWVRVAGRPGEGGAGSKEVAGKGESGFFVTAVQDVAPSCSGGSR